MRRLLCSFAVITFGALPATAGDLPEALANRLQQGVQACLNYNKDNTALASFQQFGFALKGTGAGITLARPEVRKKIRVCVFTEGPREIKCEVHANYTRNDTHIHAFNLTLAVLSKNGFSRLREHHFSSKAKTFFQDGTTSMFHLIRVKQGKVMIKFKRRNL